MNNGILLTSIIGLSLPALVNAKSTQNNNKQPNIIIIYTDDVGYGDLECYGGTVPTPNANRIADSGVQFMNAHSTSATSTPSRFGLLTGVYPWRQSGTGIAAGNAGLIIRPERFTLADGAKSVGYKTGAIGKWHLGIGETAKQNWNGFISPNLNDIGFDYSYIMAATGDRVPCVFIENGRVANWDAAAPIEASYTTPFEGEPTGENNPEMLKMHPSHGHDMAIVNGISRIGYMKGGGKALWVDEDIADLLALKAVDFIEENKNNPFLLYFGTHDIHVPRTPHPRFVGKTTMGARGDVILQLDYQIGQVLNAIDKAGIADNTIVILSSDNGAVIDDGYKDQAVELLGEHKPFKALRGGKYSAYEGGTKVPLLVSWPRRISKGVVSQALFSHIDFLATLSSIMGCEIPKSANVDSKNATKVLLGGDSQKGRDYIVQQSLNSTISVSDGAWKYIQASSGPAKSKDTNIELGNSSKELLFDLRTDKGEQNSVATTNPKVVESMQRIINSEFSKGIYAKSPIDIYLYDDMPKTSQNDVAEKNTGFIRYVENPKIQLYLPQGDNSKTKVVLVVPGGGYSFVSNNNEGVQVAKWLNENGIAAAVLHYRLPAGNTNIPLKDAQKAMDVIRLSAKTYGVDGNNIGVIGFSAGGHLAGSLITMTKNAKLMPVYAILVYPVISMDSTITHMGSRNNLLGKNPSQKLIDKYSLEKRVSTKTPQTLLVHCKDDKSVVIRNSQLFESALHANGIEAKSIYFETGSHGWGFTLSKLSEEDKAAFLNAVKNWIHNHAH